MPRWDGTEEYDLALRLGERLGAAGFGHIADILYHRLTMSGRSRRPVAAICADMPKVVAGASRPHRHRRDRRAGRASAFLPGALSPRGAGAARLDPRPDQDQLPLLKRCVETVLEKTDYQNYEIIVVDNGSTEPDACSYLRN